MKKNKMMRLASGLLVAVLITTSTISGTFAKYVTEDSAKDEARVAKFGVTVTATGSEGLFKNAYEGTGGETVTSVDSKKVVAPGTKNTDNMTFAVSGQPEVDVQLTVAVTKADGTVVAPNELEEIFLAADTYPDMTTGDATDDFTVAPNYYPVVYTVKQTGKADKIFTTLKDMATYLTSLTAKYDANQNLATEFGTLEISWAWAFGTAEAFKVEDVDRMDTVLGDLAASEAMVEAAAVAAGVTTTDYTDGTNYNLTTDFAIKVTVEQID